MRVLDFEERAWEQDGIRIVVRAADDIEIGEYPRQNAAPATQSVTDWLRNRITPFTNGHDVIVIGGDGETPHGRSLLRTVRDSYR